MRNFFNLLVLTLACASPSSAQTETGRERAGLLGAVHTVRVETARMSNVSGQLVEGERVLVQASSYDEKGNANEQSVFNPDGSLSRKLGWGHMYDAKGRESERTFLNAEGVLNEQGGLHLR